MTVAYEVGFKHPASHVISVTLTVGNPGKDETVLRLPTWIPGSYMIREFAKNVYNVKAMRGDKETAVDKTDKQTWVVSAGDGPLTVSYDVFCFDLSVRTAFFDTSMAFFNASSVFMEVSAHSDDTHTVTVNPVPYDGADTWQVATALTTVDKTGGGYGTYSAKDYDELLDCPVLIAPLATGSFDAHGARYEIAVTGHFPTLDMARLEEDLAKICRYQIELFEPETKKPPTGRYVFIVIATKDGYGGLEHRSSTVLLCSRASLPGPHFGRETQTEAYRTFLGLASHEHFHTWLVKRIKPAEFVRYDLTKETYTRLLWLFEGFTTYYDDLCLVRSRVINQSDYLKLLNKNTSHVMRSPGRLVQSLEDASFDAWIKYYRPDENSPNATVSYYTKGALVALAIDFKIRQATGNIKSLDDVLRALWVKFGREFYNGSPKGLTKSDVKSVLEAISGESFGEFLNTYLSGCDDLPLKHLFSTAGVRIRWRANQKPSLGCRIDAKGTDCTVAHVIEGGPGSEGGLSAGDVIIAVGGKRVGAPYTEEAVSALLDAYPDDENVPVHVFRRDNLVEIGIRVSRDRKVGTTLDIDVSETHEMKSFRSAWLGETQVKKPA